MSYSGINAGVFSSKIQVMEYCAGGDLSQLISKQKELRVKGDRNAYLPQLFVFKVFKQLLNALKHLHSNDKVRFQILITIDHANYSGPNSAS